MFSLMGNCCSRIRQRRQPKRPVTLAILGLDSAGKTTTTKVFLGDALETAPTVGFNKEEFDYGRYSIVLYDLGGGQRIRDIWKDYLNEIYGLIYVVDSSARERISEVKDNLWNLVGHEMVKEKPLLILANKEDIKGHMDEVDLMEKLEIEDLVNINKSPCKMVTCSAIKGTGKKMDPNLKEGMAWLCSILDDLYDTLKVRVDQDVEVVEQRRQKEKEERRERVRKQREERERQEEEENKRLGIKREEDEEDDDDIVEGANPFRRLDAAEVQRKEEKFKLAKEKEKEKKKRLKELEQNENINQGFMADTNLNKNNDTKDKEDDFHVPRSSRSLGSYGLFNGGLSQRKLGDEDGDSDTNMPRSGRQLLPPLQSPLGTKFMDGNINSNKDKQKKKKKQKHKSTVENDLEEEPYENHVTDIDNFGHSTMTVSKIEVFSNQEDSDTSDNNLAGKHKYMKDSNGIQTDSSRKKKEKSKSLGYLDEDGFDTLRLSQHLDDEDVDDGIDTQSGRSVTPTQNSSQILNDKKSGKSQTPIKKLKKKNKHLRKNKLAPSDDEFELTDVSQSPKKDLPWARSPSPKILETIKDDQNNDNRWGFAEDLVPMAGTPTRGRSRPNFESDDDLVL